MPINPTPKEAGVNTLWKRIEELNAEIASWKRWDEDEVRPLMVANASRIQQLEAQVEQLEAANASWWEANKNIIRRVVDQTNRIKELEARIKELEHGTQEKHSTEHVPADQE